MVLKAGIAKIMCYIFHLVVSLCYNRSYGQANFYKVKGVVVSHNSGSPVKKETNTRGVLLVESMKA